VLVTAYANNAEVEDKISYIASTGRVQLTLLPGLLAALTLKREGGE
jgi:hypothetical protein